MSESIFALKPCPFCGGAAEMIDAPGNAFAGQRTIYRVECKKGISCPGMPGTRGYDTEREAAAAWNTRAAKVLPKGHGRLVDADALDETVYRLNFETEESWEITRSEHKLIDSVLYEMPTIIEADKAESEG